MKFQHDKTETRFTKERPRIGKEKLLTDILRYYGFFQAATNFDFRREHIDLEVAIASWTNFPDCLSDYPTVITKKMKLDPKELAV
jgi:hypothetical protein